MCVAYISDGFVTEGVASTTELYNEEAWCMYDGYGCVGVLIIVADGINDNDV